MGERNEQVRDVVQHFLEDSAVIRRKWTFSLVVGCAGGMIELASLASSLPSPEYAFRLFVPSLWIFLLGIASATASMPIAALYSGSTGTHYAEARNRESFFSAARKIPPAISAPARLADEENARRDDLLEKGNEAHKRAESAWRTRQVCSVLHWVLAVISAGCFVIGVAIPLAHVSFGGGLTPS